jgi:hypothetical protein
LSIRLNGDYNGVHSPAIERFYSCDYGVMGIPILASLPDPAFRAQTRHIAERLQTRPSLFIEDRL